MSYIVAEEAVIATLSANNLPSSVGGGANPFKDLMEFLDKAQGRWNRYNTIKGGKKYLNSLVVNEGGQSIMSNIALFYSSPEFVADNVGLNDIVQAHGLFESLGMYFEMVQYPVFVKMSNADYETNVPSYMPNNSKVLEDESVLTLKWSEWKDLSHEHVQYNNENYIPLNSNNRSYDVCGSIIVQLISDGYDVDLITNMPVITPEEP